MSCRLGKSVFFFITYAMYVAISRHAEVLSCTTIYQGGSVCVHAWRSRLVHRFLLLIQTCWDISSLALPYHHNSIRYCSHFGISMPREAPALPSATRPLAAARPSHASPTRQPSMSLANEGAPQSNSASERRGKEPSRGRVALSPNGEG